MKRFTQYALIAGLAITGLCSMQNSAWGADAPTQQERRQKARENMKTMAQDLNLTQEQKEKLKPVIKEQAAKLKEINQDSTLSRKDKMAKLKEAREAVVPKYKEILTPEQFEKWSKAREENQTKVKENLKAKRKNK